LRLERHDLNSIQIKSSSTQLINNVCKLVSYQFWIQHFFYYL
jgi:hypothetical protein